MIETSQFQFVLLTGIVILLTYHIKQQQLCGPGSFFREMHVRSY